MKETEEAFLKRDKIAATLGDPIMQEVLAEKREIVINYIKAMAASDAQHLHYAVGKLAVIDELLYDGKNAKKPNIKDSKDGRPRQNSTKLPVF